MLLMLILVYLLYLFTFFFFLFIFLLKRTTDEILLASKLPDKLWWVKALLDQTYKHILLNVNRDLDLILILV